jgi:hypothetical protein
MNSVERHKQYVEALTTLTKDSKDETKRIVYSRLSFLAKKAGGNPMAFQKLVAEDRPNMMRLLVQAALKNRLEAQKLGRDFGKDRAIGKAPV